MTRRVSAWGQLATLAGLSAFAVGQPLLELIGRFPDFLITHRADGGDVALLVGGLFAGVPLALFAAVRLAAALSRPVGTAVYGAATGGLAALVALPLLGRLLPDAGAPVVAASAGLGAAFAWGLARSAALRAFARLAAVAVVAFPALFFANGDVRAIALADRAARPEAPRVRERTNVVVVIFDELPLTSLLAADGRIDAESFPAFARLAARATWYRNATAVASYTQQAVPAILTGRYPGRHPKLAIASEQPHNLFSLLAGSHDLNVSEPQTKLADPSLAAGPPRAQRLRVLADDLWIAYLHVVLPASLAAGLPPVDRAAAGFRGHTAAAAAGEGGAPGEPAYVGHTGRFRRFVDAIAAHPGPALHFVHSGLPHRPWRYLPSGHVYAPTRQHGLGLRFRTLSGDWWQQEAYQRHLLQVQYADRLLGLLLDRLTEQGLYDAALVVVTADHGVGFWPDDNQRMPGLSRHPEDILGVPLLIKRPGQRRGAVDDRNVETVDILPTIADLVGAELGPGSGFAFDGCSLADPGCPERPEKRAYWSIEPKPETMEELRLDARLGLRDASLRRKLAWFGAGLYRFGPYAELVGRDVATLPVAAGPAGRAFLETADPDAAGGTAEPVVPVRVSGVLALDGEPPAVPHVAVALGGRIRTVVPAPVDAGGRRRVLAMIPEAALADAERPALLLVTGPSDGPQLRPLVLGPPAR